nr:MAG: internal scaffolding protein [Microvirus sp.]
MPTVKPVLVNKAFSDAFPSREVHPLTHVRGAYDFDGRDYDPGLDCLSFIDDDGVLHETPTLTRQSDKDDCDINVMMARYQNTGVEPRVNPRSPQWGDFTDVPGYQEALEIVRQAEEDFSVLPAETRDRFGNDPTQMLRFLQDESNRDEAVKLGLVVPPVPEPPPQRVEIVNPAGAEASRDTVTAKPAKPA